MNKKHLESDFDDFLKEEKILIKARSVAIKSLGVKFNGRNQITLPRRIVEKLKLEIVSLWMFKME